LTSEPPHLWTWPYTLTLLSTQSFFGSFFYFISTIHNYVALAGGAPFHVGLIVSESSSVSLLTRPEIGRLAEDDHRVRMMRIGIGTLIG
jgi:hypothetical protein